MVRREGKEILSIGSFTLNHGENIALLGPNGAGKSTFIHLLTREVFPLYKEEPPVLFKGKDRATLEEIKKSLGIVSSTMQDQITVHLPCVDVVCGGLFGALGIPKHCSVTEESLEKAYAALELLGVKDLAQRDVMTLSSGQARRVFDEPTTSLDPEGMYYVRKAMRDLVKIGKSIVLVTHYPEDIIPEINRVVMIKEGTLFADGSKQELLTSSNMSKLFDVPLRVLAQDGYYSIVSEY